MKNKIHGALAATALLLVAAQAQAGFIVSGGTTQLLSGQDNAFETQLNALGFDAVLEGGLIAVDMAGTVTFRFHGIEAGFENTFVEANPGGSISDSRQGFSAFDSTGEVIGTQSVTSGQDLDWEFLTGGSGGLDAIIGQPGFGVFCKDDASSAVTCDGYSTSFLVIGFDDGGPNNPSNVDDNHDDYVLSATFTPAVPEPNALLLLALSMIGLGVASRRVR